MSRISIGGFLSQARQTLSQSLRSKGANHMSFVIGNQSADLDSIACAITYGYLQSNTPASREANKCIIPITNIPSSELRLRPELSALLKKINLKPSDLITLDDLGNLHDTLPPEKTEWTLVDHNALLGDLGDHFSSRVTGVIDHHTDEKQVSSHAEPRVIEKSGSCQSLVINYCRQHWDAENPEDDQSVTWDAEVALLAMGPILIDTVNLKSKDKVTDHDRRAVEYLERKIQASSQISSVYDRDVFFKDINDAKSDLDDLSLDDILRKDYKQWSEGKQNLGISSAVRPIQYLMDQGEKFEHSLLDFARSRELDLYAIMTASNDSGAFARQLLLLVASDGKPVDAAKKFVERYGQELKLEDSATKLEPGGTWMRLWEQKELSASRKQVGPMLREAMK